MSYVKTDLTILKKSKEDEQTECFNIIKYLKNIPLFCPVNGGLKYCVYNVEDGTFKAGINTYENIVDVTKNMTGKDVDEETAKNMWETRYGVPFSCITVGE